MATQGTLSFAPGEFTFGRSLRRAVWRWIQAVQYSRMQKVLHELTDAQLDEIGLRRTDIPDQAHRLVYEEE